MQGTIKCGICGRPYKWYSMTVADQTACPKCVREAEQALIRPDTDKQRRRREEYFNG